MPYAVENELTPMGREMLDVAVRLERWLQIAPDGPVSLETGGARGVLPLAAASDCERAHIGARAAPVTEGDVEAAFMLATPLVGLPPDASGACQLEVEAEPEDARAGGGASRRRTRADRLLRLRAAASPGDYAAGSATCWFRAIIEGDAGLLSFGGGQLPEAIVTGLHAALVDR